MSFRTITAFFDSAADARTARDRLTQIGLADDSVKVMDQSSASAETSTGDGHRGIWAAIKDFFVADEDRPVYEEGIRRGGYLLVAEVPESEVDRTMVLLEECNAVDLDQRQGEWRQEGWEVPASAEARGVGAGEGEAREDSIPVVDERLVVGRREVDRGSVRVRSYIREEPVQEQVQLREERVNVERRPVNQPLRDTDPTAAPWQEREIEVTETGEEAVVGKEAVVKEEVVVTKRADERVENVEDVVRHTEVDVDDSRGGARTTRRDATSTRDATSNDPNTRRTPPQRPTPSGPRR